MSTVYTRLSSVPCLLLVTLAACSSSSTPAGAVDSGMKMGADSGQHDARAKTKTDAGRDTGGAPVDAAPDVIIDPDNCVKPGTKSNSIGVGGYCSPGGGQCLTAGPDGSATLCTADLGGTPAHAWFCTYPCTVGTVGECGTGAVCISESAGSGCVPLVCGYLADGGLPTGDAANTKDGGGEHDGAKGDAKKEPDSGKHDAS